MDCAFSTGLRNLNFQEMNMNVTEEFWGELRHSTITKIEAVFTAFFLPLAVAIDLLNNGSSLFYNASLITAHLIDQAVDWIGYLCARVCRCCYQNLVQPFIDIASPQMRLIDPIACGAFQRP